MKKSTVFCLIITLILSSGCIGWATSNSSNLLEEERASLEHSITPIEKDDVNDESSSSTTQEAIQPQLSENSLEQEVISKQEESIKSDNQLEPKELEPGGLDPNGPQPPDERPINPETQNRLLVWPGQIDLSSLSTNESFSRTIKISNPNDLGTNVLLVFNNKNNIQNISVSPSTLIIPANQTRNVTILGVTPSTVNYSAELKVTNSLNSYTETCMIISEGNDTNPDNKKPLTISPYQIDLSSISPNESFEKNISIYNPNNSSAKVTLMFKNKENFNQISVNKTSFTIPSNGTMAVKVSGVIPIASSYKAELEIANNLNTSTTTCLIHGSSNNTSKRPENVKVTYDSNSEDYTITWDPMDGDIDHYNIYVWKNNKWNLWVEVNDTKYVRHYIALEVAKDLRLLITGVDSNGNNTDGTEAKWNYDAPITPPRNVQITYDFLTKTHILNWDPPEQGTVLKYKVSYYDTNENKTYKLYTTDTSMGIKGVWVGKSFSVYAKSTSGVYSDYVQVHCIPAVRKIDCVYDSKKEELKLMWEKPVDYVFRFNVYSSYNNETYVFEEKIGTLDDWEVEDFSYIKKGVRPEDVKKYKFKIRSLQTHAGESKEINLKDFYLTDENLAQPETLMGHINIRENTADISWSAIPGAEGYNVYGALNGVNYNLLRRITGATECFLESPPPYDPPCIM